MISQSTDDALRAIDCELSKLQKRRDMLVKKNDDDTIIVCHKFDKSDYTCCICAEEIYDDINCCENYHPVCSACLVGMSDADNSRCPICRSEKEYFIHNTLMDAIKKTLKGCFIDARCTYKGSPNQLIKHCKDCLYSIVRCPFCCVPTIFVDLVAHTETACGATHFSKAKNIQELIQNSSAPGQGSYLILSNDDILFVRNNANKYRVFTYVILKNNGNIYKIRYTHNGVAISISLSMNRLFELKNGICHQHKILNEFINLQNITLYEQESSDSENSE